MTEKLNIEDYLYYLPEDKIAKYPLAERDESKLLVFKDQLILDKKFSDIASYLPPKSLIILNNTRVVRARIIAQNSNGARIEIFVLEPLIKQSIEEAMQQKQLADWVCIIGNLKKWKDETITISTEELTLFLTKRLPKDDGVIVNFKWTGDYTFAELLEKLGRIPLPPYLKREDEESDHQSYQTVYAQVSGSVAAPTAGLHFTQNVFNNLRKHNHQIAYTTLHVGAGTFKPVKSETINEHIMHHEEIIVNKELLQTISTYPNDIVAVGTTTLRTLESIYWISHLIIDKGLKPENGFYYLSQWAPYGLQKECSIPFKLSCLRLLHFMQKNSLEKLHLKTQLLISPGYRINSASVLVTNFHQPASTLIVLVATVVGKQNWRRIYEHALNNNYRFLSYGDSSLLYLNKN